MLANTTKTAKLQWFSINLFPLSEGTFFSRLMASFCRAPQVYSKQKSGRWIVKGWITCSLRYKAVIYIFVPGYGLKEKMGGWENDWDHWESVSFHWRWTVWGRGNQRVIQGPALFSRLFLICDSRKLWISGGHFCCSDDLRSPRFQAKSDFEKLAELLVICLNSDRYCWRMIGGDNTHLYTLTKWMMANGRKEKIMWNNNTKFYIKAWSDLICGMNLPLMARGGHSVAGVILLSFPQARAGCGFKALISVFQQARGKYKVVKMPSLTSSDSIGWRSLMFSSGKCCHCGSIILQEA